MAETPLQGRRFDGLVTVREADNRAMIAIRGELSDPRLAQVVAETCGAEVPKTLAASWGERGGALWMAPDELLLVLAPDALDEALAHLRGAADMPPCLIADVSDMRAVIGLDGEACRDVLAKLTPADVSPSALPVGRVRRTRLAQAAAAVWFRAEDRVELVCFRSVAEYVFELLSDAARVDAAVGHYSSGAGSPRS